jgi:hypothetical protein
MSIGNSVQKQRYFDFLEVMDMNVGAIPKTKVKEEVELVDEVITENKYIVKIKETLKTVKVEYYWDPEEGEEVEREVEVLDEISLVRTMEFDIRDFQPLVNSRGDVVGFAKDVRGPYLIHDNDIMGLRAKAVILRPHSRLFNSHVGVVYTTYKNSIIGCVTGTQLLQNEVFVR